MESKKSKKSRRKRQRSDEEMMETERKAVEELMRSAEADTTRTLSTLDEMGLEDGEFTDNSEDEDGVAQENQVSSTVSPEEPHQPRLRNFGENVMYRKLTSDSVLVSLEPQGCLYFTGKCAVKVVRGVVEIYGCTLTAADQKRNVFSPKGHSSLLCVTGIAAQSSTTDTEVDGDILSFLSDEELADSLPGAVFVMQAFDNDWSLGLRNITSRGESLVGPCPTGVGPTAVLPGMKDFTIKLGFQFVPESMWDKHRLMKSSYEWDIIFEKLNEQSRQSRICVFGGKGVGKSTFNRWLTNKYLSSSNCRDGVVFVDLDPGQTEFTPPGVVSVFLCKEPLLGPNYTHICQPDRSVFLGGVSVADFPMRYLNAAVQLFEFISGTDWLQNRPVIVNTMGFCQGLGVNLAISVIKIFRPNSVVQLSINNDRRSFPFDLRLDKVQKYNNAFLESQLSLHYRQATPYTFHKINSVCNDDNTNSNPWGRRGGNPRELRDDMILSYFAPLIPSTNDFTFKSVVPLNVSVHDVTLGSMDSNLNFPCLIKAMLGNLVALCKITVVDSSLAPTALPNSGSFQSPDSSTRVLNKESLVPNNFYGYGVMRAYDEAAEIIHIITPVETALLKEHVNAIIVAGMIGLPSEIYTTGTSSSSHIPYVVNSKGNRSHMHAPGKKYYAPKKVTHPVLRTSLL